MAESTWNNICKSVSGFAKRAGRKAEELTETAAIRLKISAKRAELEDAYLALGKLTFEQNYTSPEEQTDDIAARVTAKTSDIQTLLDDISLLEQRLSREA
jgi:hypothetical protein